MTFTGTPVRLIIPASRPKNGITNRQNLTAQNGYAKLASVSHLNLLNAPTVPKEIMP